VLKATVQYYEVNTVFDIVRSYLFTMVDTIRRILCSEIYCTSLFVRVQKFASLQYVKQKIVLFYSNCTMADSQSVVKFCFDVL
jgi:hypothetical protein